MSNSKYILLGGVILTRGEAIGLLGLSEGYTEEELRKAYKSLARRYHPDVAGSGTTDAFIQVKRAYDLLSVLQSTAKEMLLTHQTIFSIVKN